MIEPRSEQIAALGTPAACKDGETLGPSAHSTAPGAGGSSTSSKSAAPSVVIVDPNKRSWIGLELVDRKKRPVPGAAWEVTLPNGKIVTGALDRNGKTRIEGIDPGQCTVKYPKLDRREFL